MTGKPHALAPIALFAYNRPEHLRRTIEALKKNAIASQSEVYIFSDAARNSLDSERVEAVREYIRTVTGFSKIHTTERVKNKGLAESIISGVSEVLRVHESVIVLEDDMVTSPYFLAYMNEALTRYATDSRVISIHGYVYPVKAQLPETFFLRGADCWGWATWRRGWKLFNTDGASLLKTLEERNLIKKFDFDGVYPYTQMLKDQIAGRNDSWAIRWYASAFLSDKLTLYPGRSLINNIGNDKSGRHAAATTVFDSAISMTPVRVAEIEVSESVEARRAFEKYFRSLQPPFWRRTLRRIRRLLPKRPAYGFLGQYANWQEASTAATGYDDVRILEKTKKAVKKVLDGNAAFERDSIAFKVPERNETLMRAIGEAHSSHPESLTVVDFGGSLASAFLQHRQELHRIKNLSWNIIEQEQVVRAGRQLFHEPQLRFFAQLDEVLRGGRPDIVLFSSVLQYLEDPASVIKAVQKHKVPYIFIDRTPVIEESADRLTVQRVDPRIYPASYPAWLFSHEKLMKLFSQEYELIREHQQGYTDEQGITLRGFLFKRI